MPINWYEVKKAIKEYRREVTEVKKLGHREVIDFFEWVQRMVREYGKKITN